VNAPAEDGEGAAAIAAAVQLPYAFARRFGVIFDGERVALRPGGDPRALIEVHRVVGHPFPAELVEPAALDRLRSDNYAVEGQATALAAAVKSDGVDPVADAVRSAQAPLGHPGLGGKLLDVRVSTLPSRAGERVVLRILDKDNAGIDLDALGMTRRMHALIDSAIHEPNGIVLVTGPTGSGKTTTLYAALRLLNDGSRNILTVEDPVEYAVDGVGQTQVNPKVGLTFAAGLRAILRQDPDVVMVGEIRDRETAEIAVQASLTGHLVLSTVHTNDAVGAITQMRDMKVEPFLLASTLRAVVAQRLVRRLGPSCRRPGRAGETVPPPLGSAPRRHARPRRGRAGGAGRAHAGGGGARLPP